MSTTEAPDQFSSIDDRATAVLVLADGTTFSGRGCGATGLAIGEVCFNTAMTGHFEVLTDPSYAQQIVCFTAPHVGNVGVHEADAQSQAKPVALGAIFRAGLGAPSSWRAQDGFDAWMAKRNVIGVSGVDTRALTHRIREYGMMHGAIAHNRDGRFDIARLAEAARDWSGIANTDLAEDATAAHIEPVNRTSWQWPDGQGASSPSGPRIVVIDYGLKSDIADCLGEVGAQVMVAPDHFSAAQILELKPQGIVLSNGPGDPSATFARVRQTLLDLIASNTPMLGICLGHQLLALAAGGRTVKMAQGHHGANHPVRNAATGQVEIVSMNHGFTVDSTTLPGGVTESHKSLFDGTNSGLVWTDRPILSVQHHPEAAPGPHDAVNIFSRFAQLIADHHGAP